MSARIEIMKRILPHRLSTLRDEMRWEQKDVARAVQGFGVDVQESQIGHVEKGRRRPSIELLLALAAVYDTSTDYLLGLTDNALSAEGIEEELAAGGIGGQYERVMARLSPERRAQALDYARYLSELERAAQEQGRDLQRLQAVVTLLLRDAPPEKINEVKAELSALPSALANEVRAMLDARNAPPADGKQQAG